MDHPPPETVTLRRLRTDLPRLLARVQAGEAITITARGKPVAQLVPPPPAKEKRPLGVLKGLIVVPDDIMDGLPEDIIDLIEAKQLGNPNR